MRSKELPKVGDTVTITRSQPRPNGERVHPIWIHKSVCSSTWTNLDGSPQECRCVGADTMLVEEQMLVEEVIYYMDNSIEAHGVLVSTGQKWHTMLDAPHGDACF